MSGLLVQASFESTGRRGVLDGGGAGSTPVGPDLIFGGSKHGPPTNAVCHVNRCLHVGNTGSLWCDWAMSTDAQCRSAVVTAHCIKRWLQ